MSKNPNFRDLFRKYTLEVFLDKNFYAISETIGVATVKLLIFAGILLAFLVSGGVTIEIRDEETVVNLFSGNELPSWILIGVVLSVLLGIVLVIFGYVLFLFRFARILKAVHKAVSGDEEI